MPKTPIQAVFLGAGVLFLGSIPSLGFQGTGTESLPSDEDQPPNIEDRSPMAQNDSLIASAPHYGPTKVTRTINVYVTAYNSLPAQTNGDPFITASGSRTRNGIVAANFLPLGTKIKIPRLYGDRVFVVEDRMHPRMYGYVDIWFEDYGQAIQFGKKRTYIEVLEG